MTLVAAYRVGGVPFLLGDFLLTANRDRAGLRKKVHRLRPNLVVGWTGHLVAAEYVLSRLHDRFRDQHPTRAVLEEILETFPVEDLGALSVKLVGWIIDGEPHCFLWDTDWPRTVVFADHHFQGSGAGLFERLAGTGSGPDGTPTTPEPVKRALYSACYLMADEVEGRSNQAAGFGHAYELLRLDRGEFSYVDDVGFLFAEVPFDREGHYLSPRLVPTFYLCSHISDYTVVQVCTHLSSGILEIARHLITPAYKTAAGEGDKLIREIVSPAYPFSVETRYSCLFARLIKDADTSQPEPLFPLILLKSSDEPLSAFSVTWRAPDPRQPTIGELEVQLPGREVFEIVFRDQTTSP